MGNGWGQVLTYSSGHKSRPDPISPVDFTGAAMQLQIDSWPAFIAALLDTYGGKALGVVGLSKLPFNIH